MRGKESEAEFQKAIITLAEYAGWRGYHVENVTKHLRNSTAVGFPGPGCIGAPPVSGIMCSLRLRTLRDRLQKSRWNGLTCWMQLRSCARLSRTCGGRQTGRKSKGD